MNSHVRQVATADNEDSRAEIAAEIKAPSLPE